MSSLNAIADDVRLGKDVRLARFINLYGCEIGDETKIGTFVEIQKNAIVGKRCKISSHSFICEGVVIEDNVFIGHGVIFINDSLPASHDSRRESADRSGLESGENHDQTWGLGRIWRHDPGERYGWRTRHGGRRKCRHQGCSGGRCRGRESR